MGELKGLYIDNELHRKIKMLAAKEGVTIREAVERMLLDELHRREKNDKDTTKV